MIRGRTSFVALKLCFESHLVYNNTTSSLAACNGVNDLELEVQQCWVEELVLGDVTNVRLRRFRCELQPRRPITRQNKLHSCVHININAVNVD